jgi:hypothetical protein
MELEEMERDTEFETWVMRRLSALRIRSDSVQDTICGNVVSSMMR